MTRQRPLKGFSIRRELAPVAQHGLDFASEFAEEHPEHDMRFYKPDNLGTTLIRKGEAEAVGELTVRQCLDILLPEPGSANWQLDLPVLGVEFWKFHKKRRRPGGKICLRLADPWAILRTENHMYSWRFRDNGARMSGQKWCPHLTLGHVQHSDPDPAVTWLEDRLPNRVQVTPHIVTPERLHKAYLKAKAA